MSSIADSVFARLVEAYQRKDIAAFEAFVSRFLGLLDETERLLNTQSYFRLSTYQRQALASGHTPLEKRNNLSNAMMMVTYWGENNPKEDNLHEYAYKEWAGMMQSYYKRRWEMFFDGLRLSLKGGQAPVIDWFHWERQWEKEHERVVKDAPAGSLIDIVNGVLK